MKHLILSLIIVIGMVSAGQAQTDHIDREIIVNVKPEAVELPDGQTESSVEDLRSIAPELDMLLTEFGVYRIARSFP